MVVRDITKCCCFYYYYYYYYYCFKLCLFLCNKCTASVNRYESYGAGNSEGAILSNLVFESTLFKGLKLKVKFTLEQTTKTQKGSGGLALLFL